VDEELSKFGNMKKASLCPLSQPWRNRPGRPSKSKRTCPTPHLYGPASLLLGVRVSLLKREDTEVIHHGALCGSTCETMERT